MEVIIRAVIACSICICMVVSISRGMNEGNEMDFRRDDSSRGYKEPQRFSPLHPVSPHSNSSRGTFAPVRRHDQTRTPITRTSKQHIILTPYVKNYRTKEGRTAARVNPPLLQNVESYAGFFEVDKKNESYMFFLFFPSMKNVHKHEIDIPLIIWLHGSLGSSSMYGAMRMNGPIRLEDNGTLTYNEYSWAEEAHLVYFDNPIGAGFSYSSKRQFSKNMADVSTSLYIAMEQFVKLFNLTKNPVYLTSQGYGGKYITSLGALIHAKNRGHKIINLKGVMIGNGFIDPPNMLRYGALLYPLGFIDRETRNGFKSMGDQIRSHLKEGNTPRAVSLYEKLINTIRQIIGIADLHNYMILKAERKDEAKIMKSFFNKPSVLSALHSAVPFITKNGQCRHALKPDFLNSEVENLKILMNNYGVLLYHGQMSIIHAYPLVLNYLKKISWKGSEHYRESKRKPWKVNGEVVGYSKRADNFIELLIRNAGQQVANDQPEWAQRMINGFIRAFSKP